MLGHRPGSIEEVHFLLTYADDLIFLRTQASAPMSVRDATRARTAGIKVEQKICTGLELVDDGIRLRLAGGDPIDVGIVYPCLGAEPRSELARMLAAEISEAGELLTDKHMQTGVSGLYAAGDVLRGLDQVA